MSKHFTNTANTLVIYKSTNHIQMAFCLGTLVELLHQILHPDQHNQNWVLVNKKISQIRSLFQKASFLRDFLANSTPAIQARIETLEDLIRDAAENAEDILDTYIKTQVLSNPVGQSFMISPPDLTHVCQVFDSAAAEMIKIKVASSQLEKVIVPIHSRRDPTPNHVLVGVDKCLIELHDRLTSLSPTLEIIPIVGMGGIGKTTIARKLYHEYSSSKHFDICLWATVSQEYDQQQVLLTLLDSKSDKANEELKVNLHQKLWSRRYLIVLDDVWSFRVWDDIRLYAPDNNNRSRIILTTRGNDVADYVSSRRHEMQLLSKGDSWELFAKTAFAVEKCPKELEDISHEIVKRCGGLPLAIQVIGGFMSRAKRTRDYWKEVAGDISSFIAKEDDQFSGIFSWSNMPHYLKPCLLYIGAFPEDHVIRASRLIKLWAAEGFLNPIKDKSLEEVAQIYLNALIDRNLIFVRERTFSRTVKSYGMHDLLRDLCMKKAEEKKFIFSKKLGESEAALCLRRVCVTCPEQIGDFSGSMQLFTQARSFQFIGRADERIFPDNGFELSLLRVLDVFTISFEQFPVEILKLVNLKYLALSCMRDIRSPLSIVVLKNLQTIIYRLSGPVNNFQAIFHLRQLRHLKFHSAHRWSLSAVPRCFTFRETLQNLAYVPVAILTQLLGELPNLKRLGIDGRDWENQPNIDLACFPVLETIKIIYSYDLTPIYPQTLRKLTIMGSYKLSGPFMSRIGGLPNLQLLRLVDCHFESETWDWEPSEGEFCNLQYLKLSGSNLENWIADETHFPQLRHLVIRWCYNLKEIPTEIGGVETLEIIELDHCNHSVFDSARSILQEQQSYYGNQNLQLRLGPWQRSDDGRFKLCP